MRAETAAARNKGKIKASSEASGKPPAKNLENQNRQVTALIPENQKPHLRLLISQLRRPPGWWCIEALHKKRSWGGDRKSQGFRSEIKAPNGALKKTAHDTAKVVGISPRKVERARTVLEHADEPVKIGGSKLEGRVKT